VSIENVKKAERLIQERARIAASKWNAVVDDTNLRERQTYSSMRRHRRTTPVGDHGGQGRGGAVAAREGRVAGARGGAGRAAGEAAI
jgi:hypothetical protein